MTGDRDATAKPRPSSLHVQRRFEQQRVKDTDPELRLRRELHARGLRYRVDRQVVKGLRRRADLLFVGPKVAVFVDGCFWHRCSEHFVVPKANRDWWVDKIDRNVARDRDTDAQLEKAGWRVVRIWEHEIRVDVSVAADRVEAGVRGAASETS